MGKIILPDVDFAEERLEEICYQALDEKFGEEPDQDIIDVLNWELHGIKESGMARIFLIVKELLTDLGLNSYQVGYLWSLGASFVAYLCGITCINPLEAKLWTEFFLGCNGNRLPGIGLYVPSGLREKAWELCGDLEGVGAAYHVGEDVDSDYDLGQIALVPEWYDIEEFASVKKSADGIRMVTELDSFSRESLYSFYIQSRYSTDMIYSLMKETGVNVADISLEDEDVIKMLQDIIAEPQKCCMIQEELNFYDENGLEIAREFQPSSFEELVKLAGILLSSRVWYRNGEKLLKKGIVDKKTIISCREDVFEYLLELGVEREDAFKTAERVRKGLRLRMMLSDLADYEIPQWYEDSCDKVRYLCSRAGAYRYALEIWWCTWFKIHYPKECDEIYF